MDEDQLSQLEVYETIVNFIQKHGVDKVKKEAKETVPAVAAKVSVDQVDAPVEAAAASAAAVSVKSSDSDSEKIEIG